MKTKSLIAAAACSALLSSVASAQLGGSLTPPPGMPAVGMKTLDQAEPRIPLISGAAGVTISAEGNITISQPGSYYLTGNRTVATGNGISIIADDVTLDLSGFTIASSADANYGIDYSGRSGIVIRNGHITGNVTVANDTSSGMGFSYGIYGSQPASGAIRVSDVTVRGIRIRGLSLGIEDAAVAERCIVESTGEKGIMASGIVDCMARNTLDAALYTANGGLISGSYGQTSSTSVVSAIFGSGSTVIHSRGVTNGSGSGISCYTAKDCQGTSKSGLGISAELAENCIGTSTTGTGLRAGVATHCLGTSYTGMGMNVTGTASFCRATLTASGPTSLTAGIAIGCSASGGAISSPQKHLGTP